MFKAMLLAGPALVAGATTWKDLAAKPYSYQQWLEEFKPTHVGSEDVFNANLARIIEHNQGSASWKAGVNKFTGMSISEFKENVIGRGYSKAGPHMDSARENGLTAPDFTTPLEALPTSVDWRTKGVVTKVKDQGGCGGCWSFSAAETLESHIAINTGKLFTFSEQEILACTPNPNQCGGTGGCSGATQELAFGYVGQAGIVEETNWPYQGVTGTCDWKGHTPVANITGYVTLPFNNYTALYSAVATIGPIAISAAAEPWMSYESGVFDTDCGADVDHAIVLEGYGYDTTQKESYWLVRNSWGEGWGEQGYIRIKRFGDGAEPCMKDNTPGDGDGCKGGPSSEQVCGLCGIMSDSSYPVGGHLIN